MDAPREVWGDLATTAFVESSLLFRSLDPDALRDLVQLARAVDAAAGETVSAEDDDGFYLLMDGRAEVLAGGEALGQLERGACFGEGRVLGGGRPAALVARTALTAVAFPAPMIAAMAERFPRLRKLLEAARGAREKAVHGA